MPPEQLIIYVILGVFFFVKFVVDTFKKQRELQAGAQADEPARHELDRPAWEPGVAPDERDIQPAPPVFVPPRRAPAPATVRTATRDPAAARAKKHVRAQPAQRYANTLRNPTELRRMFELMAILGPPRSLAPYDS